MAAFTRFTDPILVQTDNAVAGENYRDNRTAWHGLTEVTADAGGMTGTQWYRDSGPKGMALDLLEPRLFCTKGEVRFSFTGRTLILRVNVAWSWFTMAEIKIDGLAPSAITPPLLTALDHVSCDAASYGLFSDAYLDVILADGLTNGPHTCTIRVDNSDASKFFSMSGFKVGQLFARDVAGHDVFIVASAENLTQNHIALTLTNRQSSACANVLLSFLANPDLMNDDGSPVSDVSIPTFNGFAEVIKVVAPVFTGAEPSGERSFLANLSGYYPDPSGPLVIVTHYTAAARTPLVTESPSPWFSDTSTPDGSTRIYCNARSTAGQPWIAGFTFQGDALDLTVQRAVTWGILGIYDGPTDGAALLNSVDCGVDDGSLLHTYHLTGFGPGSHHVYLRKTVADASFVIFVRAEWDAPGNYSAVAESFRVVFHAGQPVAMPVENVQVAPPPYDPTFDPPFTDEHDYASAIVRTNADTVATETMTRLQTFAVFYGSGLRELLSEYDVLILDPIGAKTADVIYWQSLGIKCFGYISSGEEVGFYENPYDFASPLAPRKDGTGPGGYSSNYMFTRNPAAGPPDKNLVWASYYMNPFPDSGYRERLANYYIPQCYGGPEVVTFEPHVTISATIAAGTRVVFMTDKSPLDEDETITVTNHDGSVTYAKYQDYTFDIKTGAFVFQAGVPVLVGDTVYISYTRKGHDFDGMFWDTVDTPDVYSGPGFGFEYVPGYAEAFADMINEIGALNPTKGVISNRGFTILPLIIQGCTGVMFETWLTHPDNIADMANTDYHRVVDPMWVNENKHYNDILFELREKHEFDVFSLNYALPGDDELKAYCHAVDLAYGYSSWQTTILLNNPEHNDAIDSPIPSQQFNAFQRYKIKKATSAIWDEGASIWDDGASVWRG